MSSRRNHQQIIHDAEIEDLLQEIARLKLRLSRIERRKDLSSLTWDFACNRPHDEFVPMAAYRSFMQTESLETHDDDETISGDQIFSISKEVFEGSSHQSSTAPSFESSFEQSEAPLSKSSSVPLYDEPMYDVYNDDMIGEVLDLEQLTYDVNDDSNLEGQHNINADQLKLEEGLLSKLMLENNKCYQLDCGYTYHSGEKKEDYFLACWIGNERVQDDPMMAARLATTTWTSMKGRLVQVTFFKGRSHCNSLFFQPTVVLKGGLSTCYKKPVEEQNVKDLLSEDMLKFLQDRVNDTRWKYPDRFSQPNPPLDGGQPDIFL